MMANTHMVFGFLAALVFNPVFNQKWYFFFPLVIIGSILPDVDHENSKINSLLPITRWVPKFFEHRGFFHSVFPAAIIYVSLHLAGLDWIGIPLALGYLAHLVSDCFTKMGCNLLHPFATMRVQGFINTGGVSEFIFMGVVGCLSALILFKIWF